MSLLHSCFIVGPLKSKNHSFFNHSITSIHFKAMKETKFFKYCRLLIILMVNFLYLNGARSEVYTVGDEEEWNADADFVSWSQKYKFSVGDVLRFTYVKGQHNAYEVTEDTYRSCNVSSGVLAKYESGNDQIKLKQAKKYWFICNVPGHCLGGMRFSIDVKEASAPSGANSTTSGANSTSATITPPTESSSPLNSSKSYAPAVRWSMGINLMAFGILVRLYF